MKEAPAKEPRVRRRPQIRANLQRLRASRRQGMFGVAEILGLGCSALILIIVIISYFYLLVPARSRLETLQLERARLQNQLRNSLEIIQKGQNTQSTVVKITESLEGFQNNRLTNASQGRMSLYAELNQLIRKNTLRNTSGPSYTALLSSKDKQSAGGTKSASTKWQSVYPGIGVSLTVEGQYQNLRRFVRDLELSKQFIIVNAIELERATESNSMASSQGGAAAGARSSLVSLRLDMATYFQLGTVDDAAAGAGQ